MCAILLFAMIQRPLFR